ncbi:MAG TPA: hypothetical protein VEG37_08440 [Burkholderiales bacterium]|nr:hypothetical protein [Burkholderiales bacterium]
MKKHLAWLAVSLLPGTALAYDYPTFDRVQFVLECAQRYPAYEYYGSLYKCSCAIDAIAKKIKYDDYVEYSTSLRGQRTAGEGGGVFRDPPEIQKKAKRYAEIKAEAEKECLLK